MINSLLPPVVQAWIFTMIVFGIHYLPGTPPSLENPGLNRSNSSLNNPERSSLPDTNGLKSKPVRIVIAGLTHDHVHWILAEERPGIEIAGIFEPNSTLRNRYARQYNLVDGLFFTDLETMLDTVQPEAAFAFGSTFEHLTLVRAAAPRGIHIMVEKPLAVNMEHASEMKELAEKNGVHLLTNYETTWYGSNHKLYEIVNTDRIIGEIRKMVVHDGHRGPREIGVSEEFLEWLTDPVQNGGGAVMDFGCYGLNLMTWLMNGIEPLTVTAVLQTIKPELYPEVDDEATIIITYPEAQGIVQASWNWPYNRKDTQVYGETGYIYALDAVNLQLLKKDDRQSATNFTADARPHPYHDPFIYFAAVVRAEIIVKDTDLSSLANNLIVMKILDAARESARTGMTVTF